MKPPSTPPIEHDDMAGTENSINRVLTDFPMSIIPNIVVEPTRESLIEIHRLISANTASVALNLGGGQHVQLDLTMTAEE